MLGEPPMTVSAPAAPPLGPAPPPAVLGGAPAGPPAEPVASGLPPDIVPAPPEGVAPAAPPALAPAPPFAVALTSAAPPTDPCSCEPPRVLCPHALASPTATI